MAELTPFHINTFTRYMGGFTYRDVVGGGVGVSTTWPATNLAFYVPFSLPWSYTIQRLFWSNGGTISGNVSIGIYNPDGSAVYIGPSTAQSGASALQYLTPASAVTLSSGQYLLGLEFSSATATTLAAAVTADQGREMGLLEQAVGSIPLPSPATFAAWTRTLYPLCGFTRKATGF